MPGTHISGAAPWNPQLYDSRHAFVWQRGAELISLLQPLPGETILDLGCGTGHLAHQIADAGARVVGIDSSPEMIEEARKNYPEITFEVADAREFQLDPRFDATFSNAALHWIKEAGRVADCVYRTLKPGGRFVAEFGGRGNVRKLTGAFHRALEGFGVPRNEIASPWYFPGIAEYSALLEKVGFEVHFAALFERPTALEDGERGLGNWIRMFAGAFYGSLSTDEQEEFIRESERLLRPTLLREGVWWIDYRRIRIVAYK